MYWGRRRVGEVSHYHVKNKEEIQRLIYLTVLTVSEEPLRHIVEADTAPQEKLRRAIEHQTTVAADRSPAMTVFFREQHHLTGPFAKEILRRRKVYERYFERIIEEGQRAGVFKAIWMRPRLPLACLVCAIRSLNGIGRLGTTRRRALRLCRRIFSLRDSNVEAIFIAPTGARKTIHYITHPWARSIWPLRVMLSPVR